MARLTRYPTIWRRAIFSQAKRGLRQGPKRGSIFAASLRMTHKLSAWPTALTGTTATTSANPATINPMKTQSQNQPPVAGEAAHRLFPFIREAHYLHSIGKRFMLVATDEATAKS